MTFKYGFLYKYFGHKHLDTSCIPPHDLVQKFAKPATDEDIIDSDFEDLEQENKRLQDLQKTQTQLSKGDKVRVASGDLKNLTGVVISVKEDTVRFQPEEKYA